METDNKAVRVVNTQMQPITLESGIVIPAAGTPEAKPKDVVLSEKDHRRYVSRGWLSIIEAHESQPATGEPTGAPAPPAAPAASADAGAKSNREKVRQS